MPQLQELLSEIAKLDAVERGELAQALSANVSVTLPDGRQDFPLIVTTPDVCGGSARLIRTRIPVWVLEQMRRIGISEQDILLSYPSLRIADLVEAWSYATQNRAEIELAIQQNEA